MATGMQQGSDHGSAMRARGWHCRSILSLAAVTVALGGPPIALAGPPAACSYTVTVIESPLMCGSTPEKTHAKAINAIGVVAGERWCFPGNRRPFLWTAEGGYQPLDDPVGAFDVSVDVVGSRGLGVVPGLV